MTDSTPAVTWPIVDPRALAVIVSAPSGAGKSTLIDAFLTRNPDFIRSVSATTRPPRPGEVEGVHYFFLGEAEFDRRLAAGEFLEHATVFGLHRYGMLRSFIQACLERGQSVIKDVDVQGAAQIRVGLPEAVQIFVAPPSREELARRLRGRATETASAVERRLAEAERELARWTEFDYLIVNDDLGRAVVSVETIVAAERQRIHPCRSRPP